MPFDVRTVAFMLGLLSCLLAGMLLLTGWRLKLIRGIREYALGDLCIGLVFSLGAYYSPLKADDVRLVFEVMVMAYGQSLRINGIRLFNGEQPNPWLPLIMLLLTGSNAYWWVIVDTDIRMRVVTDSLIFCLISLLCVRALWVRTEVRMAYWLTGGAYAVLAVILLLRAIITLWSEPVVGNDSSFSGSMLLMLILMSVVQFCAAFGFMLMLNYRLAADLEHAASCDSLTGALNRRSFELIADQLCDKMAKIQQPLTLMMLDVDHFKSINDHYGHPQGDQVLQCVADIVRASIRHGDYLGRYGGEEFCVLLPMTTENDAYQIAERMRNHFVDTPMSTESGDRVMCTFSVGICDSRHLGLHYPDLLKQADKALYFAKQSGRNKSVTVTELNEQMC